MISLSHLHHLDILSHPRRWEEPETRREFGKRVDVTRTHLDMQVWSEDVLHYVVVDQPVG